MAMPVLSMFYGIIIRMYFDDHNPPHFHAEYQGYKAQFDMDGNLLKGGLPKRQQKYVEVWADIHRDELIANWQIVHEDGEPFKIEPLR